MSRYVKHIMVFTFIGCYDNIHLPNNISSRESIYIISASYYWFGDILKMEDQQYNQILLRFIQNWKLFLQHHWKEETFLTINAIDEGDSVIREHCNFTAKTSNKQQRSNAELSQKNKKTAKVTTILLHVASSYLSMNVGPCHPLNANQVLESLQFNSSAFHVDHLWFLDDTLNWGWFMHRTWRIILVAESFACSIFIFNVIYGFHKLISYHR